MALLPSTRRSESKNKSEKLFRGLWWRAKIELQKIRTLRGPSPPFLGEIPVPRGGDGRWPTVAAPEPDPTYLRPTNSATRMVHCTLSHSQRRNAGDRNLAAHSAVTRQSITALGAPLEIRRQTLDSSGAKMYLSSRYRGEQWDRAGTPRTVSFRGVCSALRATD